MALAQRAIGGVRFIGAVNKVDAKRYLLSADAVCNVEGCSAKNVAAALMSPSVFSICAMLSMTAFLRRPLRYAVNACSR